MQGLILLTSLLCALFVCSTCDDTVRYNAQEFQAKLATHKLAVVDFYAPWCHYSKALLPEFEGAAIVINSILKMNVGMVLIDCYNQDQEALCSQNKIVGYPTVKIYKNGVFFKDFNGPRTSEALVYFIMDITHGLIN
jgi:thiol-disulfide isomerase/thioredoxin